MCTKTERITMILEKKSLSILILLSFIFSPGILFADFDGKKIDENLNATVKPDHILLTWSDDPTTTQTISWRSSLQIDTGQVNYMEAKISSAKYKTEKASVRRFTSVSSDDPGSFNLFTVTLTGLKPGTQYKYIVGSGSIDGSASY